MKISIKTKIIVLCGILLLFFIPSILFLVINLNQIVKTFNGAVHISKHVMNKSHSLITLIVDMETGERGFVITGEKEYLEPYDRANEKFDKTLERLREDLTGQPKYLRMLEKIEHLRYKWMGAAADPEIEARRVVKEAEVGLETIDSMISAETGKNVMDEIRRVIAGISDDLEETGRTDALVLITQMAKDVVDSESGQRGFLLTGRDDFLEPYYAGQVAFSKHIEELKEKLRDDKTILAQISEVKNLYEEWIAKAAKPEIHTRVKYEKNPRSMDNVISLLKTGTGKKIIDELRVVIGEFSDGLTKDVEKKLSQSEQKATLINFISVGVIGAGILLSIFIAFILGRSIINPIRVLTDGTKMIGMGDLNYKIKVNTNDEFGILSNSFNKMTEDLIKSREELITAKDYTDNIIKSMVDSLVIIDPDTKISLVNKATCDLLEYKWEELIGKNVSILFPKGEEKEEEEEEEVQKLFHGTGLQELIKRGFIKGIERIYLTKGGSKIPVLFSGSVMRDSDGRIQGIICLASDISELKHAEEALRESEARLQQSQKMESIGTLAGGIAHDFNNVLYSIIGYTELTIDDVPEGSLAQKNLKEVFKGAMRAKDMVKQILAFSRKARTEKKPIKVQSVVKEALKLLRTSIPSTIEIRQNIDADCGPILADSTQIHQVVMNLATNAYQAMREKGGLLELTLMEEQIGSDDSDLDLDPGTYLKLTVSDTGHGMDIAVIEKIFDPYFSTKGPGEGTGMGLAVVHGIVKDHGGIIMVYSELGEGTVFHIYLPLIETRPVERETVPAGPAPTGTERILFVDDEEPIVFMAQQILERLGYQVTPRTSSVEALEAFRAKPDEFDLVITDLTMPNMTGVELAPKLLDIRPDIPIIICTGFSEMVDEDKAKAIGIREYVMKPIAKDQIARTIRKVLDDGKEK